KMLGGGMRQAGVLAAAGLIALEDSPKGLPEDHANAKRLAEGLAELPGVKIDPERVVTNIVIFDVSETGQTADAICAQLKERGVLASGFGSSIRIVTHCEFARTDTGRALLAYGVALFSERVFMTRRVTHSLWSEMLSH